jgi:predicted nucleic acid-binding protein
MVLVDTSISIRFLASRTPYATELDRLPDPDEVAGHDLVCGELLIGDPGARGELLQSYALMHRLPGHSSCGRSYIRAGTKLYGWGIGWIDAHLLASAMVANAPFLDSRRALG